MRHHDGSMPLVETKGGPRECDVAFDNQDVGLLRLRIDYGRIRCINGVFNWNKVH